MNFINHKMRAKLKKAIRAFFNAKNYTEAETPLLSDYLIPENHLDFFNTQEHSSLGKTRALKLIPSPEVYLKPLLAQGWGNLFCFSRCFRNSEQVGANHNHEFSMLEYYTLSIDYIEAIETLKALFVHLEHEGFSQAKEFLTHLQVITIEEAFVQWEGFSLMEAISTNRLRNIAQEKGFASASDSTQEQLFNYFMVSSIEEKLKKFQAIILTDYPDFISTTAKKSETKHCQQRWELYLNGIEVANCYSERASKASMLDYVMQQNGKIDAADRLYCQQFNHFPECSGTAIGIERLLMALLKIQDIKQLLLFPDKKPIFP